MAVCSSCCSRDAALRACVVCTATTFCGTGYRSVLRARRRRCALRLLAIYFSELYIRHCVCVVVVVVAIALAPVVGEGSKTARPLLLLPWCVQMVGAD